METHFGTFDIISTDVFGADIVGADSVGADGVGAIDGGTLWLSNGATDGRGIGTLVGIKLDSSNSDISVGQVYPCCSSYLPSSRADCSLHHILILASLSSHVGTRQTFQIVEHF